MGFRRRLFNLLPKKIRFALKRKQHSVELNWPSPSLVLKIADTQQELEDAFRLLHDSYVAAGYMDPDPSGMRILPQHLLPQTTTVVAKWDEKVVGTLSLIRDNPFGLPLEKLFDISDRRAGGRRLAEVSSLAIDPKFRGKPFRMLFPLCRFCIQYAKQYFGIHEFVIATTKAMSEMYLGFICFEKLKAKPKAYDFVKGTVAVGTYMNCETIEERWRTTFARLPDKENYYKYWKDIPTDPHNQMPKRTYHSASDPIMTPKLLAEFYLDRAMMARKLNFKDVQVLLDAYPFPEFQKILLPLQASVSRKSIRLETMMKAKLGENQIEAEVLNVSAEGLLLRSQSDKISVGQETYIDVWLNESIQTRLKIEVRWCPTRCLYGLRILETTDAWLQMIDTLEKEYRKRPKFSVVAV